MDLPPEFQRAIREALDRTNAEFAKIPKKKHSALLKRMIEGSDLALGVFNDAARPGGWDFAVIKGEQTLAGIVQNRTALGLKFTAIPCRELEEALAMKKLFGGLN